ncbi:23S rRNA (cytidine1920-2'-O)/16S rRNA (cytidine1409-2'-O)-methyltransferase [Mesoplasma entomophilum]|uniref:TlyA family rRNA (Cytidine-2'-O)-methyltransferase n=1 Tax=Mesoplasma entomophilum TaxID=2149 RepID=A0A3S5Y098_9MOLU|nr:TlyA family RNA methyltransferase [Mesoplasma entomophilum]ATQ35491.1 TlyA family rRNA (cytidine-2'-O)-methyltransferase [Mesoplasma entomophilum]ATZ19451.1 23S rRNA (cytidine1920-2'-O)/16S rRNA (cytidine1409-2'-O)-methyltransferase [Mesoplasma entomophilum]
MKKRLDEVLVEKELVSTRSKAKERIVNRKEVYVNNTLVTKAGFMVNETDLIEIKLKQSTFVSRAGLKLEKAIKDWKIDLNNKICLDIGASTGGFTEVCLENKASLVYAVDVGTDQLDSSLKNNPLVKDMQKYNFRYAKQEDFNQTIDFFCCDVSFISLDKILPALNSLIKEQTYGVVLLKPEFEAGSELAKNGKVNLKSTHLQVIKNFIFYAKQNGFSVDRLTYSPIVGNKKQNIEYLAYLTKTENQKNWKEEELNKVVNQSWKYLT